MENYKEYCRDYIINRLSDYLDNEYDNAYELAYRITDHDNMSGSFTYSTYNAEQYIKEWFHEVGYFMEEYEFEFGFPVKWNPFTESESFHAVMVIVGIEKMLGSLECIPNESFILTTELSNLIIKELEGLNIKE